MLDERVRHYQLELQTVGDVIPTALADDGAGDYAVVGHFRGQAYLAGHPLDGGGGPSSYSFLYRPNVDWVLVYGCGGSTGMEAQDLLESSGEFYLVGSAQGQQCSGGIVAPTPSMFLLRQVWGVPSTSGVAASPGGSTAQRVVADVDALRVSRSFSAQRYSKPGLVAGAALDFSSPSNVEITDLVVDPSGHLYLSGALGGAQSLGGRVLQPNGTMSDMFVAKYRPDGSHLWSRAFGGVLHDSVAAMALTPSSLVLLAACSSPTIELDGVTLNAEANMAGLDICLFGFEP